jgi:hypothetical protein
MLAGSTAALPLLPRRDPCQRLDRGMINPLDLTIGSTASVKQRQSSWGHRALSRLPEAFLPSDPALLRWCDPVWPTQHTCLPA